MLTWSWRDKCRSFIASLPWESCATVPLPLPPHQRKLDTPNPYSRLSRRFLAFIKRELSAAVTHAAAVITVVLVLVFLLGAQSSLHPTILPDLSFTTHQTVPSNNSLHHDPNLSPLNLQLHDMHQVPFRYLNEISMDQKERLKHLLSTRASNASLAYPTRRAVFAHISQCHLYSCIRAVASAVVYAQTTARVAVIFAQPIAEHHLSEFLIADHKTGGDLVNHVIIIPVSEKFERFSSDNHSIITDWAEFSVVEAALPSDVVSSSQNTESTFTAANSMHFPTASTKEDSTNIRVIQNTDKVASLDNLAAIDAHVSMSLTGVIWSRYVPRMMQEQILSHFVERAPPSKRHIIAKASVIGRHPETQKGEVTDSVLYSDFHIPKILLRGMSPIARKLLLLKLIRKRKTGIRNPKIVFIHAQYGLGNRLRALGSAMAFARRTDRILVLIWVPDQHLNCKFTELFVSNDEFVVSDSFEPGEGWPFESNLRNDAQMAQVKWYNYMRVNGKKVHTSDDVVEDDIAHHIYISTCYVVQSPVTPFILRTQSSFWQVLWSLTPQIDVVRLVDRFAGAPIDQMIGVHIRGRSIKADISGINATDYSEESSKTTDYWRNLTQVDTFVEEMRKQTAEQQFYVAADQKEVFERLEKEFPSRVFYTPRNCDSRDKDCLPFALADILLLSKCASLRCSYWSSFSELSVRIGGARFLLAGIDFGRQRPNSTKS